MNRYKICYKLNGKQREVEISANSPADASNAAFILYVDKGDYEEINVIELGEAYTEERFEEYIKILEEQGYEYTYDDNGDYFVFTKEGMTEYDEKSPITITEKEEISVYDKPLPDGTGTDWHVVVSNLMKEIE